MSEPERFELEPSTGLPLTHDGRRPMPEPPPVRLTAVEDVHLPAAAGREAELDAFYVDILRFERQQDAPEHVLKYRAANVALVFDVLEPPIDRDNIAPTSLDVPSLRELRDALIEREMPFQSVQGLMPATQFVLLRDPAGNWLAVGEWRLFA
jgi:hypothetical protein